MKEEKEFRPWRLIWTPKHIERFWDWWGGNSYLSKHYFSKRNGKSILDQISHYVRFLGTVVDLGSGPGYIVDILISRGVKTLAVDTSAESLALLEQRMAGFTTFLGTKVSKIDSVPVDDDQAAVVLLIETIEHLGKDSLDSLLREAYRITQPGGWIAVTTPNDEKLEELETMCPDCGCIYHYYQHMRSWSKASLEDYMGSIGYTTIVCKPTLFSHHPYILQPFHRLAYAVLRAKLPHLLYVGNKR